MIGGSAATRLAGPALRGREVKWSDEALLDRSPRSIYLPSHYGFKFVTLM